MKKCDCYCVRKVEKSCISQITGMPFGYDEEVSYCNGTKERDECSCGGDRTKCDFYPEVRERARAEIGEDSLIITYDCCPPDAPTLCVARKKGNKVRVLNTIQGYAATNMYDHLTRGMGSIFDKSARKPIGDLNSVPYYRCPSCFGAVVMYDKDPHYPCCQWCGQKLDWSNK